MQITERREGSIIILSLDGRLDHAGAGVFQEQALKHIREGVRGMIVDFGGTSFMASMGIRALLIPAQEMSKAGGRMAVTGLGTVLHQVFETAGLLKIFQVYDSVAAAQAEGIWPA